MAVYRGALADDRGRVCRSAPAPTPPCARVLTMRRAPGSAAGINCSSPNYFAGLARRAKTALGPPKILTATDAVRAAAASDPRSALRLAHEERNAAEADVSYLSDVLGCAREHLSGIESRRSAAEARARAVAGDAATGLIRALEAGASAAVAIDDGEAARAARVAREAEISAAAVERLSSELVDAQERLRVATWRKRALAVAVLEMHAVQVAEGMLAEPRAMRAQRSHLAALQALLVNENRSVYGDSVSSPSSISAATAAIDPPPAWKPSSPHTTTRQAEPVNPWLASLQALLNDPEAAI